MRIFRIGFLLGLRQIQRASYWTTGLIVLVMMLTFLNLVAVSGILVGLIVGAEEAVQEDLIGDLQLTARSDEDHLQETARLTNTLALDPRVTAHTVRYDARGTIEANYRTRRDLSVNTDIVNAPVVGIDAEAEQAVTGLADNIVEGTYLEPGRDGDILIGSFLIERYSTDLPDVVDSLSDVQIGDTVRLTINGIQAEFTVRGIIDAKTNELTNSAFISDRELRRMAGRIDRNANRINVRIAEGASASAVQTSLRDLGYDEYARIRTFQEALPTFLIDIKDTFSILGFVIGAVGIVVASITIFIIIFINAVSRRRQIGILKGIGINRHAIEVAYVLQAAFYVTLGSALGALVLYGFLVGYLDRNPINFPFSDGILVADPISTLLRFVVLFAITLVAGLVPAWLITRQNTLDAIVGRH